MQKTLQKAKHFIRKFIGTEMLETRLKFLENKLFEMESEFAFELPHLEERAARPRFIVTLTSYGSRIYTSAPSAIMSIFRQSLLPDKIILWLGEKLEHPAPQLNFLQEHGLEIKYCEDLKSYKKLVPALTEFPEDVLITADDDIYYPRNWLAQLVIAYNKDPHNIYCHRAHEITFDNNGNIKPYMRWHSEINKNPQNKKLIFPTCGAGCLYPPRSLDGSAIDSDEFLRLAPTADDIWFWAMANLHGTKIELIENSCFSMKNIDGVTEASLYSENGVGGGNDRQLRAVMERFPQLKEMFYLRRKT